MCSGIVPYTTTTRNPRHQRTSSRMASSGSKVVGAKLTIALPTDEKGNLSLPTQSPSVSSPVPTAHSLQEDQPGDFDPSIGAKPCSPFYCHPTTTTSREQLRCDAQLPGRGYGSQDLESGMRTPAKRSMDITKPQCSKLWQQKQKRRHRDCFKALTKKQRMVVKIVIAILIVGTMVGIAVGITAAVGGGVWRANNRQTSIGS